MKFTKDDFEEYDGQYFVGHVVDIDGSPWVTEEILEEILEDLNHDVSEEEDSVTFAVPQRKDIIFRPMMPESEFNYIHLN